MANEKEQNQPIIIKKIKKGGAGHHGGAWKVAYADFVTAMMAFFLLLWLLNVTTAEEKTAISNYFDPAHPKISKSESGSGGVLGGMSLSKEGAMVTNVQPITQPPPQPYSRGSEESGEQKQGEDSTEGTAVTVTVEGQEIDVEAMSEFEKQKLEEQLEEVENKRFESAMEQIKNALQETPQLAELSDHLLMDITPEGLRIQIVDKEGRSMFAIGSADMYPFMEDMIQKVATVIKALPNQISVRGHTDGAQYSAGATYNNWDLSADRAQSSRRALTRDGLSEDKIETVVGRADRDHLIPEDPLSPQNRRISIILLRDRLTRDTQASVEDLQDKLKQGGVNSTNKPAEIKDNSPAQKVIVTKEIDENSPRSQELQTQSESGTNTQDAQPTQTMPQTENKTIILQDEEPDTPQKRVLEFP